MSGFYQATVLSVHHWTDRLFSFTTTRDAGAPVRAATPPGFVRLTLLHARFHVLETVRIPMAGGVDSLNVAAAGAVAFWAPR